MALGVAPSEASAHRVQVDRARKPKAHDSRPQLPPGSTNRQWRRSRLHNSPAVRTHSALPERWESD
jgi:hypothetical protein